MGEVIEFPKIIAGYRYKWFRVMVNKNSTAWLADAKAGTVDNQAETLAGKIKILMPGIHVDFFDEDSQTRFFIDGDIPAIKTNEEAQALCDKVAARILKHCFGVAVDRPSMTTAPAASANPA